MEIINVICRIWHTCGTNNTAKIIRLFFTLTVFCALVCRFFLLHEKAFTEWTLKGELRLRGFVSHCTLFTESIISVM